VTTLTRVLAYGLAGLVAAAVAVLAVAGVTAAQALFVTAVGIFLMIALGSLMGGRRHQAQGPGAPEPEDRGGTMDR